MFGSISKLAGAVAKSVNMGGALDEFIRQSLPTAAMGKMASSISQGGLGALAQKAAASMGSGSDAEKLLYIAALQGAVEKVNAPGMFNLETQINDLWIRLDNLKGSKQKLAQVSQIVNENKSLFQELQQLLQTQSQLSKQVMQSLR